MHDVLVNYLEVNFPEIADQLALAHANEPSQQDRAAAAERLRELIRRLRREADQTPRTERHTPRSTASELIAGLDGDLNGDERRVLDHFFELFARSMERTESVAVLETTPELIAPGPSEPAEPEPTPIERSAPTLSEEEEGVSALEEDVRPETEEPEPQPEAEGIQAVVAEPNGQGPAEAPNIEAAIAGERAAGPEPAEAEPAETQAAEPRFTEASEEAETIELQGIEEVPAEEQAPSPDEPADRSSSEASIALEEPPLPTEAPAAVMPQAVEAPTGRLVAEHVAGALQTILLAAAQQALDLLQVDASQVHTLDDQRRFMLRAGVPTESLAFPEASAPITSRLLRHTLELNEVYNVEDLATEDLTPDEAAWVVAGFHGFTAIPLSPPLEKPLGVLVLLRRTPWRLDRRDALRLEDLALEVVSALRANSLAMKVAEVAVLQERLSLAREIHDGLASDLAAVVALFKYYDQRRRRDPEDAGQLLPQLQAMTEEILASARNILQSLRPKTIRSEGLLASVLKVVDQFGRVNLIETNVSIRGEEATLPAEQKEVIFQVLRESLANIRKHSQARNLWVVLDLSSTPWVLTVRDDGRGFDVRLVADDPKKLGSYGLVGMRERAELLGGSFEIVSQPLEGTAVTLIGPPDRSE